MKAWQFKSSTFLKNVVVTHPCQSSLSVRFLSVQRAELLHFTSQELRTNLVHCSSKITVRVYLVRTKKNAFLLIPSLWQMSFSGADIFLSQLVLYWVMCGWVGASLDPGMASSLQRVRSQQRCKSTSKSKKWNVRVCKVLCENTARKVHIW